MTSNLLIGNAGLALGATSVSCTNTESTSYPVTNLFGGTKPDYFRLATATSGDTRVKINTTSQAANFLYLGKAILLKNDDIGTITVKGHSSDNYAAGTTVATISSFGSASLYGPDSDDYITTFATSSSFPWWYVNYNASAVSLVMHSHCFLGQYFDPGRDPNNGVRVIRTRPLGANRRALYTIEVTWEGISYANAVQMYQKFYRPRRHNPIILFSTTYHSVLLGNRVLFGRVLDMTVPPRQTSYCDISMTFEELP